MKTKILAICLLSIVVVSQLYSQDARPSPWFPDKAQWYYETMGKEHDRGCVHLALVKDTLFAEKLCKQIKVEICDSIYPAVYEYLYPCGDSLFYYNFVAKDFFLLIDLSAQAGDTVWVHREPFTVNPGFDPYKNLMRFPPYDSIFSYLAYRVDKIDTVELGGKVLRRQLAQSLGHEYWEFPGSWGQGFIVEGIGSLHGFFGAMRPIYPEWWLTKLRCFFSGDKAWIGGINCDYVSVDPKVKTETSMFKLYPNPSSSGIFKLINLSIGMDIEVWDISGRKILSFKNASSEASIDLSAFPKGIYSIRLVTATGVDVLKAIKG